MRKQHTSSAAAAVSLCKVLLMILALICTLHTAPVDGAGRDRSRRSLDPNYRPSVPPGRPYTPTPPGCSTVYGCRNSP
uniref:Uncharacterized protein n=1 Tax=Oryza meridionalis TaxID=40149 RepID=A0A0E0E9W2_9ORYZ